MTNLSLCIKIKAQRKKEEQKKQLAVGDSFC